MGKGYLEMVEQVSRLDIRSTTVALTDFLVMFLVLWTVMTNKIESHRLPTSCEQREQLEKKLNSLLVQGRHQVCRSVHSLFLI